MSSRRCCSCKPSSLTRTQNTVCAAGCDDDDAADDYVTPNFDLCCNLVMYTPPFHPLCIVNDQG
ncbi:hypothetical protein A2U01_0106033 [Trifolium medium]|uniref:Uncharacterized protein n=1 Tax=Trifolium medium TaxID=97028 RepID=A0A392VD74_9FABA|nr:hypothetical protein [Trifolium medium]